MHVTRRREDFNAITYEIIKKKNMCVKLKVKLYNEFTSTNGTIVEDYYHKEYVYDKGKKRSATISISTKGYIQVDIMNYDTNKKELFFMSEAMKNKFIRKSSKIIAILEAYDDHEIDIVSTDSSGIHINGKIPSHEKVTMGRSEIDISLCVRDVYNDVGVSITFDNSFGTILHMNEFIELYHALKDLNFTQCSIALLGYIGTPELGSHEVDLRQPGILDLKYQEPIDLTNKYNKSNTMKELSDIGDPQTLKSNTKISW